MASGKQFISRPTAWLLAWLGMLVFFSWFIAQVVVLPFEMDRHGRGATASAHALLLSAGGVFAFFGIATAGGLAMRVGAALFRGGDLNSHRDDIRSLTTAVLVCLAGFAVLLLQGKLH